MKGPEYYDKILTKRGARLTAYENHFGTQVMRRHCQQGRWLDLGCGCGQMDWYIARDYSVEIVGLDFSSVALRLACDLPSKDHPGRLEWVRGNILDIPFGSDVFDGCICSHVLEHIEDIYQLIDDVVRVVKPGGLLVAIVPHLYYADDPSHYWHFTVDQFDLLLTRWGMVYTDLQPGGNQIGAVVYLGGLDET